LYIFSIFLEKTLSFVYMVQGRWS